MAVSVESGRPVWRPFFLFDVGLDAIVFCAGDKVTQGQGVWKVFVIS